MLCACGREIWQSGVYLVQDKTCNSSGTLLAAAPSQITLTIKLRCGVNQKGVHTVSIPTTTVRSRKVTKTFKSKGAPQKTGEYYI